MARLLSGSTLRRGGSGEFLDLKGSQPQLPATDTTTTGYTLVTDALLRTSYRSSLGNLEMHLGEIYSNIPDGNITLTGTGTGYVYVSKPTDSVSTSTGALVVRGGIGVGGGIWTVKDIHVNGLTIGRGYEGVNNIVIQGAAEPQIDDLNTGQESIVIGYDALTQLSSSYKSIAIGRYALNSGTLLSNSIAIGDSALKAAGSILALPVASITNASQTNPVVVTAPAHGLNSGTEITISGVVGMTELNGETFYISKLSSSTIALYSDNILGSPINGTGYTGYISGGTVSRVLTRNDNIAIGNNAAIKLIDGEKNFFFGYNIATNLTTGSNNFFFGHEVASNITNGSNIIALGGDNLVDGVDDQINIGSVFYYNGNGKLSLNADSEVGLSSLAVNLTPGSFTASSTLTGALTVIGGAAIYKNLIVGTTATFYDTTQSFGTNTGALSVAGGVGIAKDLWVGGVLHATIAGSINTATNLSGGSTGTVVYQIDTGNTGYLPIGSSGTVLLSDGTTPYWGPSPAAGSSLTATNSSNIFVNPVTSGTLYYLSLNEIIGTYSPVDSDTALTYSTTGSILTVNRILVSGTATSTSTTTGALVVTGGVGVSGSVRSQDGNVDENYLLYSPKVTVSNTPPTTATNRIGDFWICPALAAEYQWIKDDTSYFWLQIAII